MWSRSTENVTLGGMAEWSARSPRSPLARPKERRTARCISVGQSDECRPIPSFQCSLKRGVGHGGCRHYSPPSLEFSVFNVSSYEPAVGQSVALHASQTDRNSFLISVFPDHSTSFFLVLFSHNMPLDVFREQ